ncbi:hypothetical protein [Rugamonas sp.]|uniref:hypothetical protein n=1 Tax=Rugamonas sp. TaxID=1926287 RepID=UPI0025E7CB8A|nr:hypothetical protein [Rugamonas sp.]
MNYLKPALTIALLACSAVCTNAWAQHGHGGGGGHGGAHVGGHYGGGHYGGHYGGRFGIGIGIGAPLYWPGWYGAPYYDPYYYPGYYAPTVVVPADPPVYVERSAPAATSAPTWSYCSRPAGYYPYVKQCDVPWRAVDPASVPAPR